MTQREKIKDWLLHLDQDDFELLSGIAKEYPWCDRYTDGNHCKSEDFASAIGDEYIDDLYCLQNSCIDELDIDYDEKHLKLIEAKEKIIDFLPKNLDKIIDLGTGTGLQLIKLYKEYPNVHTIAIDISDGMLKKLEEKHISDNITIF